MEYGRISSEAEELLKEIIQHEGDGNYWKERFEGLSDKDDVIIRGCFKELRENGLVEAQYADNYPYLITILKDGYLYEEHMRKARERAESPFEHSLNQLLERAKTIKSPINAAPLGTSIDEYNAPAEEWMNDVQIFHDRYLKEHSLSQRINSLLFHRGLGAFKELVACLKSISNDEEYIRKMRGDSDIENAQHSSRMGKEYDVFISHANSDKADIVDELYKSLDKLGIKIFYDKEEIEWGDDWKQRILNGTEKSEFAIIVISENFFGREWTERELKTFLNQQNKSGQKTILPILHNISVEQLAQKYPTVADIQAISSQKYNCDEIAILFAKQLIKRLKSI